MTVLATGTVTFNGGTATGAAKAGVTGRFLLTPQRRRLTTDDAESIWPDVVTIDVVAGGGDPTDLDA